MIALILTSTAVLMFVIESLLIHNLLLSNTPTNEKDAKIEVEEKEGITPQKNCFPFSFFLFLSNFSFS